MLEKHFGCFLSASEKSEPPRTSSTHWLMTALKPRSSACSARISKHSRSGMPAPSMVASWRVKTIRSASLTRTPFHACPFAAPPPPKRSRFHAAFFAAFSESETTTRFWRLSSPRASLSFCAVTAPLTVFPAAFRAW
ncbi:MAG TPA: hypothetical protein VHF22_14060 [Planctomycetota bacterium]|nr:hypothetical protein [Planctomycetota bacterium]